MNKKRNRYDGEFKLNSVKLVLTSKGVALHSGFLLTELHSSAIAFG